MTIVYRQTDMDNEAKLRVLRRFTVDLCKNMNPDDLKVAMFAKNLLTADDLERNSLPNKTTRDKNMFILMKLPSTGRDGFDLFMECLKETGEENPAHLELLTKIMAEVNQGV